MTEDFTFNARQYFDFSKDPDDFHNDSYFEMNEEKIPSEQDKCPKLYEDISENERHEELSDTESDFFFSPMDNTVSTSTIFLKGRLRKSLSMNNLPTDSPKHETKLSDAMDDMKLTQKQPRASSTSSLQRKVKPPSQDHINRLAQPKRCVSQDHLDRAGQMTLAQAVVNFEKGTPRRFRSRPSPKINKAIPLPWGGTKAHSPKLMTTTRIRPVSAISREEQERKEVEEARKFKIKANPINKKAMKGPLKPQIEKKPVTAIEPFQLTEIKKRDMVVKDEKVPAFKAQPLPKSLHNPFKVHGSTQPTTKGQSPSFSKRVSRSTPNKVENPEKDRHTLLPYKPSRTQPMPFSFEQRDKQLMKKKEEFINRVLEEEKKAREFHAKPPPKAILRSRNASQDRISEAGSTKSFKRSVEDLNSTTFKARPATVLMMKPFEPKKDENHIVKVEAFQFNTDQRVEARHKFEEKIKEREALAEAYKREQEEALKRLQEEEIARMRKQMEHKAQPIKKYKKIQIQPANKVTEPISPKFHTDKIRNKENIQQ